MTRADDAHVGPAHLRPETTMPADRVSIHDHRTVRVPLPKSCVSRTPKGNRPIACDRAEITYDIPTGALTSVEVWGYLTDQRDVDVRARDMLSYGKERATGVIVRRYVVDWKTHIADAPDWLAVYIERYRPTVPAAVAATAVTPGET